MGDGAYVSPAGRVIAAQLVLGVACTLVSTVQGSEAARSAALATMSTVVPSTYYAWMQVRTYNATRLLALGVFRMLMTGTLMALSIVVFSIEPVWFFVTFAAVQFGYIAAGWR